MQFDESLDVTRLVLAKSSSLAASSKYEEISYFFLLSSDICLAFFFCLFSIGINITLTGRIIYQILLEYYSISQINGINPTGANP